MVRERRLVRLAGDLVDLQRPHDPPAVGRQDDLGCRRVECLQPGMQRTRADNGQLRLEPRSYVHIGAGELELVEHRPQVQRRAAHHDRSHPSTTTVADCFSRPGLELSDRGRLADVEQVKQVMRYAAPPGHG